MLQHPFEVVKSRTELQRQYLTNTTAMLNLSMNRNCKEKNHELSGFHEFRSENLGNNSSNSGVHVSLRQARLIASR